MEANKKIQIISVLLYTAGTMQIILNVLGFIMSTDSDVVLQIIKGIIAGSVLVYVAYTISRHKHKLVYWIKLPSTTTPTSPHGTLIARKTLQLCRKQGLFILRYLS